jgi:type VI secretion system protein VasJ
MPENMDLEQTLDFGAGILANAAAIIAGQSPHVPLVCKLNRLAAWLPVTELPPAEAGRTVLPAPDDQELQALKRLYASRSWADLLEFTESLIGRYLFWLDLNRYSWEALTQLGHTQSGNTVAMETQMYAARLPGIENLAFNDGTPFADDDTRSWLKSGVDTGGQALPSKPGLADEISRARDFFSGEPLNVSLKKISGELGRLPSGRERLVLKTGLCRILTELNQPRLAQSFAEDILLSIEQHRIENWEPELAVEGFAAAVYALRRANESEERVNSLLNRIAVLDPLKALDLI